jgi:nucleoside-diphosphate-sugar epimerase
LNIAIMGSNSHIAKGLMHFGAEAGYTIVPFSRSTGGYGEFLNGRYDVVINCVGPGIIKDNYADWFTVAERYDNLAMQYLLEANPEALYIHFSSGKVYGDAGPATKETRLQINPNHVPRSQYLSITKLYAESKHRVFDRLNIVDVRVFAYFSRWANLEENYFMSLVAKSLIEKRTFITDNTDVYRDFMGPRDLFELVRLSISKKNLNVAVDAITLRPASKMSILDRLKTEFSLNYYIDNDLKISNSSGFKDKYYTTCTNVVDVLGYKPTMTSEDTVVFEMRHLLNNSVDLHIHSTG